MKQMPFPSPQPPIPNPLRCDFPGSRDIFKPVLTRVLTMDAYGLANADAVLPGVKAGDPAAQEALYRAFEAPVYNLARRICRTTEDAEDVMQETFFEVFRSIGRFRGDGSLWGWVDRKSTRLNSSHGYISYAVFCLKKKSYGRHIQRSPLDYRHRS